mmetsp:Transcript_15682/g.54661  ORF Transcript_15682/g.54661 Transcript_15682/m.54661 type:complete len:97 (-) Transcript_15682:587-877(-)
MPVLDPLGLDVDKLHALVDAFESYSTPPNVGTLSRRTAFKDSEEDDTQANEAGGGINGERCPWGGLPMDKGSPCPWGDGEQMIVSKSVLLFAKACG